MARKTDIINLVEKRLKRIEKGIIEKQAEIPTTPYQYKTTVNRVFPKFKFLQEINDFPTVCFIVGTEQRQHLEGNAIKYGLLDLTVVGYVRGENIIDLEDDLLDDLEFAIGSISYLNESRSHEIEEVLVNSVGSDEGLLEPFGVCRLEGEILYRLDSQLG